eukprot:332940-Rhodomonas_salina.1
MDLGIGNAVRGTAFCRSQCLLRCAQYGCGPRNSVLTSRTRLLPGSAISALVGGAMSRGRLVHVLRQYELLLAHGTVHRRKNFRSTVPNST